METTEYYLKPVHNLDLCKIEICHNLFTNTKLIAINSLTPNQINLDPECLKGKIKGTLKASIVYVLNYQGINILMDGHHTVISKKIKGIKKVRVKYLSIK